MSHPEVDEKVCVNCGKCKAVCPVLHCEQGHAPTTVLAEKNKNENVRATSSSGGVFYELARKFIQNGGVVYGCILDNEMVARHICASSEEEIEKMKSSKYVQSDMGEVMLEIRTRLLAGEKVLFSGTPCQVAGLKNYLGRDYKNLLVVDVLCHGVPSPKVIFGLSGLSESSIWGRKTDLSEFP